MPGASGATPGQVRGRLWAALDFSSISLFDTLTTTRGFTGHEMVDPVGLVHMNGRVYDPEIGRFLSADPFIQDISDQQAWNRYSYVLNNPLSLTDPTGFFFGKIFKAIGNFFGKVFSAIASAFKAVLKLPILRSIVQVVACSNPIAYATCIPTAGALALAAGGSLVDAVKAMAFTAASWGIWDAVGTGLEPLKAALGMGFGFVKATVHGVVGGAMSLAQGGSFLEGFVSSGVAAFAGFLAMETPLATVPGDMGVALRSSLAGAFGGLGAQLTGGKFANGFLTGAFAHLWNAEGLRQMTSVQEAAYQQQVLNRYVGHGAYTGDVFLTIFGFFNAPGVTIKSLLGIGSAAQTRTGTSVIGRYPTYLKVADEIGANAFNIPAQAWSKMSRHSNGLQTRLS